MEDIPNPKRRDLLKAASAGLALQTGFVGVSAGQDQSEDRSVFDAAKQDLRITNNEKIAGVVKIEFKRRVEGNDWKTAETLNVPVGAVHSSGMIKKLQLDLKPGFYKIAGDGNMGDGDEIIGLPEIKFRVPNGGIPDYWSLSINLKKTRPMMTYYEI